MGKIKRFMTAVVLASLPLAAAQEGVDLSPYYGFRELEILKSDFGIHSLVVCDLTGNGLNDIAAVNNQRSRIELYIQKENTEPSPQVSTEQINELVGFGRFERQELLLTIQPDNLVCGDLNGSGRPDLAVYAEASGLNVFYQEPPDPKGKLLWQSPRRIVIRDGLRTRGALACGDINGDGKADVVLAGSTSVFVLVQEDDGTLSDPLEYPSLSQLFEVRLCDFNGDGHNDLVMVTHDRLSPLHVRFGQADGTLGPVIPFRTEAFTDFELLSEPRMFLSVERVSGRLSAAQLKTAASEDDEEDAYATLVYPLADSGQNTERDMVTADVNGDGRKDIVISQPGDAKITLFLNSPTGLCRPEDFPALSRVVSLAAADVDGDGCDEVVMLSVQERTLGLSRFENGRLSFPAPIRVPLEPVAMTLGDMDGKSGVECVYVGRSTDDVRYLGLCKSNANGVFSPLGEPFKLEDLKANPQAMTAADIDQDGLMDVLIFRSYEEPLVIRQIGAQAFEVVPRQQSQSGLIKAAARHTLTTADINHDGQAELLLSQQNFARALRFGEDGVWRILDQYNAAGRNDEVVAAVQHDIDDDGTPEMILLDRKNQQLQILKPGEGGAYRPHTTVPVGSWNVSGQLKLLCEDLLAVGRHLVLFDGEKFAFVLPRRHLSSDIAFDLENVLSWETRVRDGRYAHLAVGDVNSDGRDDIVLVESRKNYLDILTYEPSEAIIRIVQGTRFQVFEQKSFGRESPMGTAEPRELVIADVTADGAADIVAIVHDRIVIYPQDL